ncbi:hypothetical protein [Mycobacterium colombiense]|uniref:hypothetical protein n=1 Tax=Mycobacterium colombiense TaxID=339268 RepID=UPI0012DB5A54|nr:hypothetical protein [Mycobacterium colombiense]
MKPIARLTVSPRRGRRRFGRRFEFISGERAPPPSGEKLASQYSHADLAAQDISISCRRTILLKFHSCRVGRIAPAILTHLFDESRGDIREIPYLRVIEHVS